MKLFYRVAPRLNQYLNTLLLCGSAILLMALQLKELGWIILGAGLIHLLLCGKDYAKQIILLYFSLAILGFTPIATDISYGHMVKMGTALLLAVLIPYLVLHYLFYDDTIQYPINLKPFRNKKNLAWLAITALLSVLIIPFYLINSEAWHNWEFESDLSNIARLFAGTNALGIWDELFFINTALALLRKHFSFPYANLVQAVLFTSFLFELGFTSWGPLLIFPFALIQGYTFYKTHSLAYVIAIHLTIDFVLFLALINIRYPELLLSVIN